MTRPSGPELPDAATTQKSSRDRLADAAAALFRQRGYHGTALSEVLADAGLPKGSLYHHFPNGKADLARAAARRDAAIVAGVIDQSFEAAERYEDGACTLCHKLAKLFDTSMPHESCPISGALLESPEMPEFRTLAAELFAGWRETAARHAVRFGLADPEGRAEHLLVLLEGGWTLARSEGNGSAFRRIAARGIF